MAIEIDTITYSTTDKNKPDLNLFNSIVLTDNTLKYIFTTCSIFFFFALKYLALNIFQHMNRRPEMSNKYLYCFVQKMLKRKKLAVKIHN